MRIPLCRSSRYSLVAVLVCVALGASGHARQNGPGLPERLSDAEFWTLVSDASEPGGTFNSENFVSNERSYQTVLDEAALGRRPASAYIGVGPEQNFTYIAALEPRIAFIVDIRRQNLVQHLMYKALFELSADRAEFLARLFSRPKPKGLDRKATIEAHFDAFTRTDPDLQTFYEGLIAVRAHLMKTHGFALTRADELGLERLMRAFADAGPALTYAGPRATSPMIYPTFEDIMRETDASGAHRHFLASDANFQAIRTLQRRNLIVPIVGDFSGPRALKAVGAYVRAHNGSVTAFYTSNVEQYLFMAPTWHTFYENVATLPVTPSSVFIRGVIRSANGQYSASPTLPTTSRYETRVFSIPELVGRFNAGQVRSYYDVIGAPPPSIPIALLLQRAPVPLH